ncbi:MAG: hypothetical protein N3D11_09930, partial [Candidatus Sumerlaeia bacterium]|nr:hypothetical protein [Candidatus Sumerlaeia bacterium]
MRSAAVALEAYSVDWSAYPLLRGYIRANKTQVNRGPFYSVYDLTTPVSYLSTTMLRDPFVYPLDYD